MTALERRCRWLLRAYPPWYQRERGDEMLGTLMEASPPGRRRPSLRDARALIMGGLRVRAGQDQRLTTAAGLRLAVLLGAALALLGLAAGSLSNVILAWSHFFPPASGAGREAAFGLLTLAVVSGAWFAPRPVAAVLALAAAAGYLLFWGDRVMAIRPAGLLVTVAILVFGRERLPRSWLWLAGAVLSAKMLAELAPTIVPARRTGLTLSEMARAARLRRLRLHFGLPQVPDITPHLLLTSVPWIVLGLVVAWAVVDARPALAMAIYLTSEFLITKLLDYIGYSTGGIAPWQWYLPAAGAAMLAAAAVWRLRRQAVL
jgi:hypothetical protein